MKQPKLIIIASTFPRWVDDSVPSFVKDLADKVVDNFEVSVVAPHYKGALRHEKMGKLNVRRFRYAYPERAENIVYEGHAATKATARPIYMIKLLCYVIACIFSSASATKGKRSIINAHWIVPQGFVAIVVGFLTRSKTVMTVHGGDVFTLNGRVMRHMKRWILRHADEVIVNSSATKAACEKIYPDRTYHVIPMGIDLYKQTPSVRKSSQKTELLFVGRMSEEKGARYAIEAIELLEKNRKGSFHLTLVGDGPELNQLRATVKAGKFQNSVTFTGWLQKEALRKKYAGADIFIGPSIETEKGWKEALGLTFAEASYAYLPVIATRTGGIPDVVLDGTTGILVDERSAQGIAQAVEKLAGNTWLAHRMGRAGHQHVTRNFSWESVATRYRDIFMNIYR